MINQIKWVSSNSFHPHENLALEETLFQFVDEETLIFYLWQNQHTVVIGRNQNAIKECKVSELHQDQGILARRLSGGGAVYHDLGNLNFTFLMSTSNFDVNKQAEVLLVALKKFGIDAQAKGRNDLVIEDKKFSGHAYYHHQGKSYHHGTLMVNVNMADLSKYLNVSKLKLQGKGVKSVVSRVTNLIDFDPNLTIEGLKSALLEAVVEVYQAPLSQLEIPVDIHNQNIEKYSSEEWLFNQHFVADTIVEDRFDWGEISIHLQIEKNKIKQVEVYSDAMDAFIAQRLKENLEDELFTINALTNAINETDLSDQIKSDLITLFDHSQHNPF